MQGHMRNNGSICQTMNYNLERGRSVQFKLLMLTFFPFFLFFIVDRANHLFSIQIEEVLKINFSYNFLVVKYMEFNI